MPYLSALGLLGEHGVELPLELLAR